MITRSKEAKFDNVNDYGQSFAHAIARMADVQTVKILTEMNPPTLKADVKPRDASGKTNPDYFEERINFSEEGEQTELRETFAELIPKLEGNFNTHPEANVDNKTAMNDLVRCDILIITKFDISSKITELADDGHGM